MLLLKSAAAADEHIDNGTEGGNSDCVHLKMSCFDIIRTTTLKPACYNIDPETLKASLSAACSHAINSCNACARADIINRWPNGTAMQPSTSYDARTPAHTRKHPRVGSPQSLSQCFPDLLCNIFLRLVCLDLHHSVLIEFDDLHAIHEPLSAMSRHRHSSL